MRVTFEQFISWVAPGHSTVDEHWTPVVTLCNICNMNYNLVGRLETWDSDMELLALKLNVSEETMGLNVRGR